jgi:probable HAF family extracellular repeat protein
MRRNRWSSTLFIATLAIALWGSTRQATTQSGTPAYGVTNLGTIGGATSVALAISNETGFPTVAGYGATASGDDHGLAGNANFLTNLGTLGGRRSEASAIFNSNAVGRAQLPSGAYHAVLFANLFTGVAQDLGTLGGSESYATAINDSLVVVGASQTAGNAQTRAFIYQNNTMSALAATLGGPNTVASGISTAGHIAGYADLSGGQSHHAFLYANGLTSDLGSLGGNSEALAVNDTDVVVGRAQIGTAQHAFRYQGGAFQDLGTLGGASSEAAAVNSAGVVAGWAQDAQGARRAFIWRQGVMTDLNTLIRSGTGWVLQAATGIGPSGGIVGYGLFQGQLRAFLLTPPLDIHLRVEGLEISTNSPNPHEAGRDLLLGTAIRSDGPFTATGITITNTVSGPVEIPGFDAQSCVKDGLTLTCRLDNVDFARDFYFTVRATGAGTITHTASVTADQPDPNTADNTASESNLAVSLASLVPVTNTVVGGQPVFTRATLTSPTPTGGATVALTSSNPAIASVPSQFDVLPGCCDGGMYREFYVRTTPVSAPVTVQIGATYGLVTKTFPLTITPSSSGPWGGTPWPIPGTIQAEDFDAGGEGVGYHDSDTGNTGGAYRPTDVDIELTSDTGGGSNVGWIAAGEWLAYTANVGSAGPYTLDARVASNGAGGTFHIEVDRVNKTGAMTVPNTGGWQAWTTVSRTVMLDAGVHVVRVVFDSSGAGGAFGNLNYVRFTAQNSSTPTPFGGTPRAIPGTIQAEDFDNGGEGVAYHDATPENTGGQYRTTGVDIQPTSDTGGGFNVGWMSAGEWLNYTISVGQGGTYTLTARVAASGAGGTFHVDFGGVNRTGPLTIPNTGGWQTWTDVSATVTLNAGVQSMRFMADANGPTGVFGNLNSLRLTSAAAPPTNIVFYSTDLTLHGSWVTSADASAAGGNKVSTQDLGFATASAPLAAPTQYFEATFNATAGTPYAIWLRIRATGDSKFNESFWVQFSDARAGGASVYPIGSTSGLLVNLEACNSCGVSGWGWQHGAYWLAQATTVSFATTGVHTIRVQVREDGAQIDQIVLSPTRRSSRSRRTNVHSVRL